MALARTPICAFGTPAPAFSLPDTAGRTWSGRDCAGPAGLLVMFISNHCPYVRAIRPRLVRDCREMQALGIGCVAVMPNDYRRYPEDAPDRMRAVAAEFGFPFPYLLDETQQVARAFGAVCTPDFFGYNAALQLQYRGRLDAAGPDPDATGLPRELFEAMRGIALTGQGPRDQLPSVGCSIKWHEDRA